MGIDKSLCEAAWYPNSQTSKQKCHPSFLSIDDCKDREEYIIQIETQDDDKLAIATVAAR